MKTFKPINGKVPTIESRAKELVEEWGKDRAIEICLWSGDYYHFKVSKYIKNKIK